MQPGSRKLATHSLERILQAQGFGTRRECRARVRAGHVAVNGEPCDDPFAEFATAALTLTVNGKDWPCHALAYLMLHKPAGYECSQKPLHHPGVYSLLPEPLVLRGVQAVGRLDADTTGLLLLSDDGQFIHRMAAPKWKVPKRYRVTVRHPVGAAQIAALKNGVQLHDEPGPIAALECLPLGEREIELTLAEGKYHQVKRMLAAAGNRVEALARVAIGDLVLPADLTEGDWRWLGAAELAALGYSAPLPY